ncbi:hypothetical protein CHARACLAT_025213 [Characodon lateralis]|uniref:Uncharacterized protein n=1 Tax=Characodon lateralis TaxID=208331 RepID=A0ABU7D0P4_9TELE|nr:hypothetical protein [Characodon lateralis]
MDIVHSLTLPIHTLYFQVQVPIPHRGNDPGGGTLPSRGKDRQTTPAPAQTSAGTTQTRATRSQTPSPTPLTPTPVPNDPHPHPKRGPCTKEGSTWSKRARQPEPPQDETVPTS